MACCYRDPDLFIGVVCFCGSCEFDFSIYGLNNIPITSLKVIIKPYKGTF